jgi:uncharacterized protein YkwD
VRGVFEMLGFEVDWDNDTSTAIITNANYTMLITIGSNVFTVNSIEHTLDVPAQNIGGRTMVPIRLPLESVGIEVDWDGATSTVLVLADAEPRVQLSVVNNFWASNSVQWQFEARDINGTLHSIRFDENNGASGQELHSGDTVAVIGGTRTYATLVDGGGTLVIIQNARLQVIEQVARGGQQTQTAQTQPNQNQGQNQANQGQQQNNQGQQQGNQVQHTWQGQFAHNQSSILLPLNRRLTDAELQAWRNEYIAMGGVSEVEREVLRLINIERQRHGSPPLQIDYSLSASMRLHAQFLANADFIYNLPVGSTQGDLMQMHGFGPYGGSGQISDFFGNRNHAGGNGPGGIAGSAISRSPQEQVDGWMNSIGHRGMVLNAGVTHLGIGMQIGASGQTYYYARFARGASISPTAIVVPHAQAGISVAGESGQNIGGNNVRFINNSTGQISELGHIVMYMAANVPVSVTAEPRSNLFEFVRWEVVSGRATIANPYSATTEITMLIEDDGNARAGFYAVFREVGSTATQGNSHEMVDPIWVNSSQFAPTEWSPSYITVTFQGERVTESRVFRIGDALEVSANVALGYTFHHWMDFGGIFANRYSPNTTLTLTSESDSGQINAIIWPTIPR